MDNRIGINFGFYWNIHGVSSWLEACSVLNVTNQIIGGACLNFMRSMNAALWICLNYWYHSVKSKTMWMACRRPDNTTVSKRTLPKRSPWENILKSVHVPFSNSRNLAFLSKCHITHSLRPPVKKAANAKTSYATRNISSFKICLKKEQVSA